MRSELRDAPERAGALEGGSLGELFRRLAEDTSRLVREEIALALLEVRSAGQRAARDVALVVAGISVAGVGALALLAGVTALLGALLGNYWLAALLVALVLLAGAAWPGVAGLRQLRSARLAPTRTIESLKGSGQWAKGEVSQLRSSVLGAGEGRTPGPPLDGRRSGPHTHVLSAASSGRGTVGEGAERGGEREAPEASGSGEPKFQDQPPPRSAGWIPFLKHVGREIADDDVTGQAAKLAYYAFLAMPPALMAVFGLAGFVGSEQLAAWIESQAALALPEAVTEDIIQPFIEQVVLNKAPGPFSVGLLLALWGGSNVFAGLMDALNMAYDVQEDRSFIRKRAIALGVMLGGAILFIAAAVLLLAGPEIAGALGLGGAGGLVWNLLRWPLTFVFVVGAFWVGYYVLPNRDQKRCKKVLVKAAAAAAVLWVLATALFRVYIANFSSYSESYGFLGAFIILLLWLFVTGLAVLAGGELASEMEKRAA